MNQTTRAVDDAARAGRAGAAPMRSFSQSLPMALLRAREAAMALFRPMLAEHELTEQQWRVLRALAASPDAMEVGAIANATFLLAPSLSRILQNLEERGLVERNPVASDQRRAEISLTTAGRDLVADVAPESEAIYGRIEDAFGEASLQRLLRQLDDLRTKTALINDPDTVDPRDATP